MSAVSRDVVTRDVVTVAKITEEKKKILFSSQSRSLRITTMAYHKIDTAHILLDRKFSRIHLVIVDNKQS
jgi:hypothetical protein